MVSTRGIPDRLVCTWPWAGNTIWGGRAQQEEVGLGLCSWRLCLAQHPFFLLCFLSTSVQTTQYTFCQDRLEPLQMEWLFPLYIMLIPDIPSHKEESGWHSFLETTQGVIFTDELGDYGVHLSAVAILRHCMHMHVCYICSTLSCILFKKPF